MRFEALARASRGGNVTEQAVAMKIEDALRKIRLLRQVKPENGASDAEAENAAMLVRTLMERFAVKSEDVRPNNGPMFRMSWVYWEQLLNEYGLELRRFGKRGSARIGRDQQVLIRLDTGEWRVERTTPVGAEQVAADKSVETFRTFLSKNAPRMYSLSVGNRSIFRRR